MRQPFAAANTTFATNWRSTKESAEQQFLELAINQTHHLATHYLAEANRLWDELKALAGDDNSGALEEAKAAGHTVAERVKATEYQRQRARWSFDLARSEAKTLGIKKTSGTQRQRDTEPKPGTSGKRVFKKAQRKLPEKKQGNRQGPRNTRDTKKNKEGIIADLLSTLFN